MVACWTVLMRYCLRRRSSGTRKSSFASVFNRARGRELENDIESKEDTLKHLAILGSTGSIGQSTLSIVEQFPERYQVAALAAGRNLDEILAQAVRWRPKLVSLATEELAAALSTRLLEAGVTGVEVTHGTEGTVACATLAEADFVVS